ncbi:TonB-dependent receptor [Lacihabitans soyangensis]|uniref:TonB-dependent receptor n=1 Tax=Lacihabitans soyangensis TaxID=869394 RepID=A0AAE3KTM3_9BACT|nr:TonB-dependent receptor [Lacihabitans soyangensis]MCP9764602.1 TonB-dependent receptor [Lacihabitans soyangensis]
MKYIIFFIFISIPSFAQFIEGKVTDKSKQPLPGVLVFWSNNTNSAVFTDQEGLFKIDKPADGKFLIFKFLGYFPDTLVVENSNYLNVSLKEESQQLEGVIVNGNATLIDKLSPIHTEIITTKTLAKAACCNLSESFETNASVSVSYADAVTGSKQIQLLGLSGTYVQTNIENIPNIRGLASTFGFNYVPGTWIQSIDVGKGVGSVVNGYENMIGALNVELKKPEASERVLLNMYFNNFGRSEANLNLAKKLSKKWAVGLLSHGSFLKTKIDNNGDGFLDLPKYDQVNLLNRWKYTSDRLVAQFGLKYLKENRVGGQVSFESRENTPNSYGFTNNTQRVEFFSKTAILFPDKPYRGLGLILNASTHNSDSYFGFKPYFANQNTLYGNLIYQDIIGNTNHTYKTGLSFLNDNYDEDYAAIALKRNEIVPGAFFEYSFNHLDRTNLLVGLRNDFHNLYGNQFSPRIHFKQEFGQNQTLRLSAGRGFRVANPLAEYYGNLVSSRSVRILEPLNPEVTWTFGSSYMVNIKKLSIAGEFYYTHFENQMIADMEHAEYLYFYNTEGKSNAKSALLELNYGPVKNWEVKLAYRYVQIQQTMGKPYGEKVLLDKMFLPKERVLLNVGYAFPYEKWKIDGTLQWNGKRRIADMEASADHKSYFSMPTTFAPSFVNLNGQVSRNFPRFEYYLGGENLTGFKQKDPIYKPQHPFSTHFDAGMAWGPVVGATIYTGFRYKLI